MGKRGIISPIFGCTEAAFFGKIRSMLRKQWSYSQPYKDAIKKAKKPYMGIGRRKFSIECECCGNKYAIGERVDIGKTKQGKIKTALAYVVHHKEEAGKLNCFDDLSGFAERLFCAPKFLQVLCYFCHQTEHKKETV